MNWTDVVEALSGFGVFCATILGFYFVVRQIRLIDQQLKLVERTLQADTNTQLCSQSLQILAHLSDKPYLYDYFYNFKSLEPNDPHKVEVLCLCEMIANYSDLVALQLSNMPPEVQTRWSRFITDTLAASPALREHLHRYRLWYSDELLKLL